MRTSRVRKLTLKDRAAIRRLGETKTLTYKKIGEIYNVSKGRISQIINDNYNESEYEE